MGRVVALLGACVFALAAPTSANKAWDIFTSAGEENGADATPPKTLTAGATPGADFSEDYEAYYETHPLLVADEAAGVGEEMTGVDDGGTEESQPSLAQPSGSADEASGQEAAAAMPPLMDLKFVQPEGLPAVDPRLQTDAATVQPQQPLSHTVSASAGEDNQRACPVMRLNEQPIREACKNNPDESCTKCLPELSNQLVPQLVAVDPPFSSAAEIQETAMRCFPAQIPVLAPLVPELPSLLSCDLQAVLNNIDLTKFETLRTPQNAHLFDEAAELFQEVNGVGETEGNGQVGVPSTEGDAETPRWYEGPFERSAAAMVTTVTTIVLALVASAAALAL